MHRRWLLVAAPTCALLACSAVLGVDPVAYTDPPEAGADAQPPEDAISDGPRAGDAGDEAADAGTIVVGDPTIETHAEPYAAGTVAAFSVTTGSGPNDINALHVYLDGATRAVVARIGLYPGTSDDLPAYTNPPVASGDVFPTGDAGGWYTAALDGGVQLGPGKTYWFLVLVPRSEPGPLVLRDRGDGGFPSRGAYDEPCDQLPPSTCLPTFVGGPIAGPLSAYASR
jgi:hypothetical protein